VEGIKGIIIVKFGLWRAKERLLKRGRKNGV
jgi:hypothetical protein